MACGPDFPNNMLDRGDEALLTAPVANFLNEIERMRLVQSRFKAVEPESDYPTQAADCESADLARALKKSGLSRAELAKLRSAHELARAKLKAFVMGDVKPSATEPGSDATATNASIKAPKIEIPANLPQEFADYLEGAIIWHNPEVPDKSMARDAWQRVLALPAEERRFKSTWAAFMLGRFYEGEEPEKAIAYFEQVRELARSGFADSAALAAASLGLEARVYLNQNNYTRAIDLYLDQLATGDSTASLSLQLVASQVVNAEIDQESLVALARNPRAQKVITAYLVSRQHMAWGFDQEEAGKTARWLQAVERADIRDVEAAEKLALAAYQANAMDVAARWVKRAPNSPLAQWLQAKLLLRAGKTKEAAAILARVARLFPLDAPDTNQIAHAQFKDTLLVPRRISEWMPAGRQALGELGVVHLSRREYTQALDALLNAGFWIDAAYVAERVLTLDELKSYVDQNWPPAAERVELSSYKYEWDWASPAIIRRNIRYLLARRLTRSIRGDEARPYYPAEWVPQFDLLADALRVGWDENQSAQTRAHALFQAAVITRTNGLELIGTEVEPDWAIHGGDFEAGVTWRYRDEQTTNCSFPPASDEIRRASHHNADPEERFHYRYQAAFLGWEAAKLMPDNSDQTAYVLWRSGSWLKNRDPDTADLFYKSLVNRNRRTALGAEADRQRWFPLMDEQGNILPAVRLGTNPELVEPALESTEPGEANETGSGESLPMESAPSEEAVASEGTYYVVHRGDSIASIAARHAQSGGRNVTVFDVVEANPGLDPAKLEIGRKILIPSSNLERQGE